MSNLLLRMDTARQNGWYETVDELKKRHANLPLIVLSRKLTAYCTVT
jgi:hypothetical protein